MARTSTVVLALVRMSRPSQLVLIGVVYALGAAIAAAHGAAPAATRVGGGLCALLPAAASVHYVNEYADHETDALTERTPFSGGSGALPETGLSPRIALWAGRTAGAVAIAAVAAHVLAGLLHPVPVAILAVIGVLGWAYSVGPALAWRGLGELDNAVLGGLVLPLYGYAVVTGTVTAAAALACVPFLAAVFANLLATQWPDREADAAVGKETLAVRLSPPSLRRCYRLSVALAMGSVPALWAASVLPTAVAAASLAVAPLLAVGDRWYTRRRSPLPTVAAMVLLAVVQLAAWAWVAAPGLY